MIVDTSVWIEFLRAGRARDFDVLAAHSGLRTMSLLDP